MLEMYRTLMILLLAVPLLAAGRNDWHETPVKMEPSAILLEETGGNVIMGNAAVRFYPDSKKRTTVTLQWNKRDSANYRFASLEMTKRKRKDDIYPNKAMLRCGIVKDGAATVEQKKAFSCDDDFLTLRLAYDGYAAKVSAGANKEAVDMNAELDPVKAGAIALVFDEPILCQRLTSMWDVAEAPQMCAFASEDVLLEHVGASDDPVEGEWGYLDRDIDNNMAFSGGKYRLAIVKNGDDGYDIVYLGGSQINEQAWEPLMVKGRLTPTNFTGNYDLQWLDANCVMLDDDNNAQLSDDGAILTLRFPVYKSQIRFKRM